MKTNTSPILLAALLTASASILHAQSFVNGSFEAGLQSHPNYGQSGNVEYALNAVPDSWNLFSTGGYDGYGVIASPRWMKEPLLASAGGNNFLWLESNNYDHDFGGHTLAAYEGGISQTVSGFDIGSEYQVSLDAGLFDRIVGPYDDWSIGAPGVLDIYLDGVLYTTLAITNEVLMTETLDQSSYTITGSLQEYGFNFVAGTSSVDIGVRARIVSDSTWSISSGENPYVASIIVDNFNIAPVPEPSGALLLGLTGTLALLRRRRAA